MENIYLLTDLTFSESKTDSNSWQSGLFVISQGDRAPPYLFVLIKANKF